MFAGRCVYVRNRPQQFATVRARSLWPCPTVSFAKGIIFRCFQCRSESVRVAGVALCDISTFFMTCQKSLYVAGAILSRRFQRMRCIFCGRRSTFAVSCCVFCANRLVRAARSSDKVQTPRQVWRFVTCDENQRMPRTKRRL